MQRWFVFVDDNLCLLPKLVLWSTVIVLIYQAGKGSSTLIDILSNKAEKYSRVAYIILYDQSFHLKLKKLFRVLPVGKIITSIESRS